MRLFFLVFRDPQSMHSILWGWWGEFSCPQEGRRQGCGRLTDRRLLVTQLPALHRQVISQDAETEAWKTRLRNSLRPCDCQALEPPPSPSSFVESEMLASFTTPPGPPEPPPALPHGLSAHRRSRSACMSGAPWFFSSVLRLRLLKLCSLSFVSRRTCRNENAKNILEN